MWIPYKIIKHPQCKQYNFRRRKSYITSHYHLLEDKKKGSCALAWENVIKYQRMLFSYFWQKNQLQGSWLKWTHLKYSWLVLGPRRSICISSTMTQEDKLLQMTHLKSLSTLIIRRNSFQSVYLFKLRY